MLARSAAFYAWLCLGHLCGFSEIKMALEMKFWRKIKEWEKSKD